MSKHLHCAQAVEPLATGRANNFRFDVNDKPARQPTSLGIRAGFHRAYFSTNLAISDVRFTMAYGTKATNQKIAKYQTGMQRCTVTQIDLRERVCRASNAMLIYFDLYQIRAASSLISIARRHNAEKENLHYLDFVDSLFD